MEKITFLKFTGNIDIVRGSQIPFLRHPPFKFFCFPLPFLFHSLLRHFIQFPHPTPTVNPPTLSNTQTSPKPSHGRYVFSATSYTHLNSNETNQNLIHCFFSVLLYHQIDYWLLWFKMIFLYRVAEEEKLKFMFKHMTQS